MSYWKFLRSGARGPFTGHPWSTGVGSWVDAGEQRQCAVGIHACRLEHLPYWMTDELWEIELREPIVAGRYKIVAQSGRLVARVDAWNAATAEQLKHACVERVARHAADELGDAGLTEAARRLGEARAAFAGSADLQSLRAVASECASAATGKRQANLITMLLVDAVDCTEAYPVAMLGYIAARAAGQRTRADVEDPYEEERRGQAAWLQSRLGLTAGG